MKYSEMETDEIVIYILMNKSVFVVVANSGKQYSIQSFIITLNDEDFEFSCNTICTRCNKCIIKFKYLHLIT